MDNTGIVRPIDQLGRIVIPKELRKIMELDYNSLMAIYVEEDMIILKKFADSCAICGSKENLANFNEKCICSDCLTYIKSI